MIKKNIDQDIEHRQNMRGGEGDITIRHYFKKEDMNARCRFCAQLTIAPGASIGLHDHVNEDEVYIIHQGQGIITDEGKETTIEPGDAILTGKGASHSIRNNGNTPLILTAVIMEY